MSKEDFGGGSLLIAWQLKGKNVLIIGGGEVASQRIASILVTDAHITVISPIEGLNPRTKQLIESYAHRITHYNRVFFGTADFEGMDMILTALDDVEISRAICQMSRAAKIPVNAADIPDSCDFYFGSQIRDGPLQIMISTNGNGPKMANLIRRKVEKALTGIEGEAIAKVGELRERLKVRAPGVGGAIGKRRMKWMTNLCNAWTLEDLVLLDGETMEKLLDEGWENDCVPSPATLGSRQQSSINGIFPRWGTAYAPTIGLVVGVLCATLVIISKRR
ncbi:siroheme synthase [Collybia nuda]|uniref:precorrin-2 dehydrogenase n=1 Tax=Collybia nuda TaxID=64659 RepID=A0A9P6CR07_9AGAR|nr:siroheme synthase [Collybia nuda]